MKKAAKKKAIKAIFGSEKYSLYFGELVSFDPVTRVAVVRECRHVCHWEGATGGITSLAAHGICGPNASKSRIGAPAPGESILTGIVNVFPCSGPSAESIEAAGAKVLP